MNSSRSVISVNDTTIESVYLGDVIEISSDGASNKENRSPSGRPASSPQKEVVVSSSPVALKDGAPEQAAPAVTTPSRVSRFFSMGNVLRSIFSSSSPPHSSPSVQSTQPILPPSRVQSGGETTRPVTQADAEEEDDVATATAARSDSPSKAPLPPIRSSPTKLFVSETEDSFTSTPKPSSGGAVAMMRSPCISPSPSRHRRTRGSTERSTGSPTPESPLAAPETLSAPSDSRKNILDFTNWFSSEGNSSVLASESGGGGAAKEDWPRAQALREPLTRPSTMSDPIESNSSSPFKLPKRGLPPPTSASGAKRRKRANGQSSASAAPPLPKSNITYDLRALNEANRSSRTKEELLATMAVHVPPLPAFESDYMKVKFGKTAIRPSSEPASGHAASPIVFWKRKITAQYDETADLFVPCLPTEVVERNLVVYLPAAQLVSMIQDSQIESFVDACVHEFRARTQQATAASADTAAPVETSAPYIILLIEGYDKYRAKLKAAQDRLFKQQVRKELGEEPSRARGRSSGAAAATAATGAGAASQLPDGSVAATRSAPSASSAATAAAATISIPLIEKRINKLQIAKNVNVFYTKSAEDSVDWLHSFSYTIALSFYDSASDTKLIPKVKSGVDTKTTFLRSLQQFKFITEVRAEKVYHYYGSLQKIYQKLVEGGAGLGKGTDGSNVVPPSTDKAVRTFFTSMDPDEVLE